MRRTQQQWVTQQSSRSPKNNKNSATSPTSKHHSVMMKECIVIDPVKRKYTRKQMEPPGNFSAGLKLKGINEAILVSSIRPKREVSRRMDLDSPREFVSIAPREQKFPEGYSPYGAFETAV